VKRVRLKRGWSKTEMAIAMDCTAHTVARLEREGVLPAHEAILEAFLKLAAESEVPLEELEDWFREIPVVLRALSDAVEITLALY